MELKEIKLKGDAELQKDLLAMREKVRELRFKLHAGELKNHREIPTLKKSIARILTILKERAK